MMVPYLSVGSKLDARDLKLLKRRGFTHILNVADDVPNYHGEHFEYCHLPVHDFGMDEGISRIFVQARTFVEAALAGTSCATTQEGGRKQSAEQPQKPNILLHCAHGCNRSVTVCVALLMMIEGLSLRRAIKHVYNRRSVAWIEPDNIQELIKFEKQLNDGQATVSLDDFRGDPQWLVDKNNSREEAEVIHSAAQRLSMFSAPSQQQQHDDHESPIWS